MVVKVTPIDKIFYNSAEQNISLKGFKTLDLWIKVFVNKQEKPV